MTGSAASALVAARPRPIRPTNHRIMFPPDVLPGLTAGGELSLLKHDRFGPACNPAFRPRARAAWNHDHASADMFRRFAVDRISRVRRSAETRGVRFRADRHEPARRVLRLQA